MLTLPIKVQSKYIKHFNSERKREGEREKRKKTDPEIVSVLLSKKEEIGNEIKVERDFGTKEKGRKEKEEERKKGKTMRMKKRDEMKREGK